MTGARVVDCEVRKGSEIPARRGARSSERCRAGRRDGAECRGHRPRLPVHAVPARVDKLDDLRPTFKIR